MKILIKENHKTRISFSFPLFFLKSKLIARIILRKIDEDKESDEIIKKKIVEFSPILYKEIKKAVKYHGHFYLVEVISKEGDEVLIKI